MSALRCVELDPRPGDLVRVIPEDRKGLSPAPIRVTEVTADRVYWQRCDISQSTGRDYWSGQRIHSGSSRLRLELIEKVPA